MSRSIPEWTGKTPDAKVPPRVRLRVFERHNGICHISGRRIMPGEAWELEHVTALILGGEHRETNLRPALVAPHKEKTADEMKVKAKTDAVRKRHLGITKPKGEIKSRGFDKSEKPSRGVDKSGLPTLPKRPLYKGDDA